MRKLSESTYRIAQIVEWNNAGQSCIAVLCGARVVSRHATYIEARAALAKVRS